MNQLLAYLNSMAPPDQVAFAARCGTTVNYLRKAVSAKQRLREGLCILIDRESAGVVRMDVLRPDVDWAYLRERQARACSAVELQDSTQNNPQSLAEQAQTAINSDLQGVAHA